MKTPAIGTKFVRKRDNEPSRVPAGSVITVVTIEETRFETRIWFTYGEGRKMWTNLSALYRRYSRLILTLENK